MSNEHPHLLLVDDENAITTNLAPFLERSGFRVSITGDGEEAVHLASNQHFDLIVMDILMPHMDGREALRQMRRQGTHTPVILLTQVGTSTERALALEEGADDYLNKPFDPHELLARIRAVLRRSLHQAPTGAAPWRLEAGSLVLDRRARRATLEHVPLTLTPKALGLLEFLMTHPDELISRERLLEAVWGWDYPVGTRAVDTRMAELRRALQEDPSNPVYIETIAGEGYRFAAAVRGVANV